MFSVTVGAGAYRSVQIEHEDAAQFATVTLMNGPEAMQVRLDSWALIALAGNLTACVARMGAQKGGGNG